MFTIEQIKEAHSKVKSGADFPQYVQDIIKLGVVRYSTFVTDGQAGYSGENGYHITSPAKYAALEIAPTGNKEQLERDLKAHQAGRSDYSTFCQQAADAGVEKWIVDTVTMTCTYHDMAGNVMVAEVIPAP